MAEYICFEQCFDNWEYDFIVIRYFCLKSVPYSMTFNKMHNQIIYNNDG